MLPSHGAHKRPLPTGRQRERRSEKRPQGAFRVWPMGIWEKDTATEECWIRAVNNLELCRVNIFHRGRRWRVEEWSGHEWVNGGAIDAASCWRVYLTSSSLQPLGSPSHVQQEGWFTSRFSASPVTSSACEAPHKCHSNVSRLISCCNDMVKYSITFSVQTSQRINNSNRSKMVIYNDYSYLLNEATRKVSPTNHTENCFQEQAGKMAAAVNTYWYQVLIEGNCKIPTVIHTCGVLLFHSVSGEDMKC